MPGAPRKRETHVSGSGKDIYRRGDGLGTGPVGNPQGLNGRPGFNDHMDSRGPSNNSQRSYRSSGGIFSGGGLIKLIIIAVVLLGGGGGGLSLLLGGGGGHNSPGYSQALSQGLINSLTSGSHFTASGVSSSWKLGNNTGRLDTAVAPGARSKRTSILGNNKDNVTIMVYMCGADLESRSGMATSDIQEMLSASIGNKVNLILYTGGASQWQNNVISSRTNQIYKIENGRLKTLESKVGALPMTDPDTLSDFIKYCKKNYPANRMDLIFWDHGGGSITGYGYDEKFQSAGSMSLAEIRKALTNGGVQFDFVGFDACLMATVENALMLDEFSDYLIASEETEPGIGWYYTNWLTQLSKNTSMSTLEIGRTIADDFVATCAQKCPGQGTTLSVVDLAELSATVPEALSDFASSTLNDLQNNGYSSVAKARSGAREFARSSKIDQIDLASFTSALSGSDAEQLSRAVLGAVKYNKTSHEMTDAYGLSIYFPYSSASKVGKAVSEYDAIGMEDEYSRFIQKFASLELGGQQVAGGAGNIFEMLGQGSSYNQYSSSGMITDLLMQMMQSQGSYFGRSIDPDKDAQYLYENRFNGDALMWTELDDGSLALYLSEAQWDLITDLELSLLYDDGQGYIDMGLDNVYDFTYDGGLVGNYSGTWIAINDQPVAYYHISTLDDGTNYTITGRVPAMLNGKRVNLILVFTNDDPYGHVAGAEPVYKNGETETVSKNLIEISDGDQIDFLCDYYSYDGDYTDSYYLGDTMIVDGDLYISDVNINSDYASPVYRFTDIYNQNYWITLE